ncbi:MAG: nucleotidyltransferase domain-containing protein [Cyclobacteriaceae bacterium]
MNLNVKNITGINQACKKCHVDELYVFGSVLTKQFTKESDIDFLVTFGKVDPMNYFDNYLELKDSLEYLLDRQVDLVESQTIKNPILRRSIEQNKRLIYGGENSKVFV